MKHSNFIKKLDMLDLIKNIFRKKNPSNYKYIPIRVNNKEIYPHLKSNQRIG